MIALLLAGTAILCGGLLTALYGISIKEFSFGGTMIITGVLSACTGLLLIGLGIVVRELRHLAGRLDAGRAMAATPEPGITADLGVAAEAPRRQPSSEPMMPTRVPLPPRPSGKSDFLFSREAPLDRDDAADRFEGQGPSLPSSPPAGPRRPPFASPSAPPSDTLQDEATASQPPRRNFLFSSRRRAAGSEGSGELPEGEYLPQDHQHERAAHVQEREEPTPAEEGWTEAERAEDNRPESEASGQARTTSPGGRAYQAPRRNETPAVTVVKSGVVDTMAYTLYSDGSIEAQMPEGMVRFESIEELRAHLDRRS